MDCGCFQLLFFLYLDLYIAGFRKLQSFYILLDFECKVNRFFQYVNMQNELYIHRFLVVVCVGTQSLKAFWSKQQEMTQV